MVNFLHWDFHLDSLWFRNSQLNGVGGLGSSLTGGRRLGFLGCHLQLWGRCSGACRWQWGHLYLWQNLQVCAGLVPQSLQGLYCKDGYWLDGGAWEEVACVGEGSSGHWQVYPLSSPLAHATWLYRYFLLHLGHSSLCFCFFLSSGTNGVGGGVGVTG